MKYLIIFLILIGFAGMAFAVPEPLPEDDFRYSDHVVTGKIISSEIIIDPREDNSAATFYDTIIYKVKVEKWHKNPLADDTITVYGTHFPNDVIPEPNWGVLEFEIGDTVYLYIDKTDEGLKFREYGSKLLYSKDSGKTEITLSPLDQLYSGISPDEITCKAGLELIQKKNGLAACVTSDTREKLIQRNWAADFPMKYIISHTYWSKTYLIHHTMCAHIGVLERTEEEMKDRSAWNMTDTDLEKIPIIKSMIEYNSRGLYSSSEYPITSTIVSDEIQNQYRQDFGNIVNSKSDQGNTFWYNGKYYDADFLIC